MVKYEYDPMLEKYNLIEVATGEVLLKELREETMKRFQQDPKQFSIKKNTSEEAGAPFHVRMLMDEFANINEIPGFSDRAECVYHSKSGSTDSGAYPQTRCRLPDTRIHCTASHTCYIP